MYLQQANHQMNPKSKLFWIIHILAYLLCLDDSSIRQRINSLDITWTTFRWQWTLWTYDWFLWSQIQQHSCTAKLFADDINVFVYIKTVSDAHCKANRTILNLSKWFNANKLTLNFEKSCYSVFGHAVSEPGSTSDACKCHSISVEQNLRIEANVFLKIIRDNLNKNLYRVMFVMCTDTFQTSRNEVIFTVKSRKNSRWQ